MSTTSTATGLPAAPVPKADPIRTAVAAYREAKEAQLPGLFVRMFGYSAFADGGPNFDVDAYDEESALGQAVEDQAAADAAMARNPKAVRRSAVTARIFGPPRRRNS